MSKLPYEYLIIAALCLMNFGPVAFCVNCAGIFYTPVANEIGCSPATLSYYLTAFSASMVISLTPLGKLFARTDCRIIMTASTAVAVACFVGLSFVQADWQFLLLAFIMGFALASFICLAPPVLVNRWFSKRAGFFIGLVMAFTGVGGVLWATVGGILIAEIGWRTTYLVFAALTAVFGFPCTLFVLRNRPSDVGRKPFGYEEVAGDAAGEGGGYESQGMTVKEAQANPSFKLFLLFGIMMPLGAYVYGMIPSYIATLPVSVDMPLLGAIASSCAMAASIVAKMVWGALGEKNLLVAVTAACSIAIVGVVVLILAPSMWFVLCVAAVAYGCYYGEQSVFCPIVTRQLYGMRSYSELYSRISICTSIGVIAGSFIGGTIINITGSYQIMFAFMIVSMVLSCVVLAATRKAHKA